MGDRIVTPYEGSGARAWDPEAPIAAPLRLHEVRVPPAWVDYNGHMSESCYLLVVGDDSDAFFRYIGIDEDYRAGGRSLYTVETHLRHLGEASEGEPLAVTVQVLDHDAKRVHIFHTIRQAETDAVLATAEQMLLHVDTAAGRTAAMPDDLRDRLRVISEAHAALGRPDGAGRSIGIPG